MRSHSQLDALATDGYEIKKKKFKTMYSVCVGMALLSDKVIEPVAKYGAKASIKSLLTLFIIGTFCCSGA